MFTIIHVITPNAEQHDFSPIISESKTLQIGKTFKVKTTAKRKFIDAVSACLKRTSSRLMFFTIDNEKDIFTLTRKSNGEIAETIQIINSGDNTSMNLG